jgi:hypothetical protein
MSKPVTVFTTSAGVNNITPENKLRVDYGTGLSELRDSFNCVVDSVSGVMKRRKGWVEKETFTGAKNFFAGTELTLFVRGNYLFEVDEDFNFFTLVDNLNVEDEDGNALEMVFGEVIGRVYFANGIDSGFVTEDGTVTPWEMPPEYYGPVTQRTLQGPPEGILKILSFKGRLLCLLAKWIIYSERWDYGSFALADNYWPFPVTIDAEVAGKDCVYVGTTAGVFALLGDDAAVAEKDKVSDSIMLKGSLKSYELKNADGVVFSAVIWVGTDGIYVGDEAGKVVCITENKFKFETNPVAWAAVINDEYWCKFEEVDKDVKGIYVNLTRSSCGFFNGLNFLGVGQTGKTVIGLTTDRICEVFGCNNTDDGEDIQAYFDIPKTDLGIDNAKRVRKFKLGFWSDGDLKLFVITGNGGLKVHNVEGNFTQLGTQSLQVNCHRMNPSRYIGFRIWNVDGSDFIVDSGIVIPVIVSDRKHN